MFLNKFVRCFYVGILSIGFAVFAKPVLANVDEATCFKRYKGCMDNFLEKDIGKYYDISKVYNRFLIEYYGKDKSALRCFYDEEFRQIFTGGYYGNSHKGKIAKRSIAYYEFLKDQILNFDIGMIMPKDLDEQILADLGEKYQELGKSSDLPNVDEKLKDYNGLENFNYTSGICIKRLSDTCEDYGLSLKDTYKQGRIGNFVSVKKSCDDFKKFMSVLRTQKEIDYEMKLNSNRDYMMKKLDKFL